MNQPLPRAGCYAYETKAQQYQILEIQLPLRRFGYSIQLVESVAYLELEQIYYNQSNSMLNVDYMFPVNSNAAMINFEISFGGHNTRGVIKDRKKAEEQFNENKKENRGVGFGGYHSPNAKDIMKIKLGNIEPKQEIKVKLAFIHTVSVVNNTFYQFTLPTTITPRYVSNLSPEKVRWEDSETYKNKMEGICNWFLKIKIKSSKKLIKFFSKNYKIKQNLKKIDEWTNEIQIDEVNMKPNKDFILCYTFQNYQKPTAMIHQTDNNTQAIVSFIPKFSSLTLDNAENLSKKEKEIEYSMSTIKGEYIFFLDRSGSMDGSRIETAKEALVIFLKSLPENSYFNIVSFGSTYSIMFNASKKYQKSTLNEALKNIEQMKADMGGTEILKALEECMKHSIIQQYPRHIFILTDGAVSDTASVIAEVAQNTKYSRVHCIGIGSGCSQDLITNCAIKGKGYSIFITDKQDPSLKIIQILERSLSPVITNMAIDLEGKQARSIVPNPSKLPYVLKNEVASFFINFEGKLSGPVVVTIKYTDSLGHEYYEKIKIQPKTSFHCEYIGKMVAFVELNALYSIYKYGLKQEDHIYYVKNLDKQSLESEIIKKSIQSQILNQLTAFICVDESRSDQQIKARQNMKKQQVSVKPMNPFDHVFKVTFCKDEFDFDDSESDEYIDECCMIQRDVFPSDSGNFTKKGSVFQYQRTQIPLKVISKGQKTPIIQVIGLSEKKKVTNIMDIVKQQEIDGKWSNSQLVEQLYHQSGFKLIQSVFRKYVSDEIWQTLAIVKWIELFRERDLKSYVLILRKAKEYIDIHSKSKPFEVLEKIWYSQIMIEDSSK